MPDIQLTERETQIAKLVIEGWDRKAIASQMDTSAATVNNDLRTIYRVLKIKKATQIAKACKAAGVKL